VLVEQPETGDQAEQQPEPAIPGVDDADHDQGAEEPEQHLEGVHREEVEEEEVDRRDQRTERGDRLGRPPAAQFAGEPAGEKDHEGSGQERYPAEGGQRLAEELAGEPRQPGGERRVVDVAPGEVLAAGDIVELVPEPAIGVEGGEMKQQPEQGDPRRYQVAWPMQPPTLLLMPHARKLTQRTRPGCAAGGCGAVLKSEGRSRIARGRSCSPEFYPEISIPVLRGRVLS
jgi:hypothetical protein